MAGFDLLGIIDCRTLWALSGHTANDRNGSKADIFRSLAIRGTSGLMTRMDVIVWTLAPASSPVASAYYFHAVETG